MPLHRDRPSRHGAVFTLATLVLAAACGGAPGGRHVIERDLGALSFRRYQRLLDVEFPVAGNPAVAHAATYVRREDGEDISFSNAVVTVYDKPDGLAAAVAEQLRTLGTYIVTVHEEHGHHVFHLDGGDDRWDLWISGRHVVKVRAEPTTGRIPDDVISEYLSAFPSDLDAFGRAEGESP
ncbi:MAG: hypothetical protein KC416_16225 [Myxococcales bacterium]|nr:hypothetical protein [Myxococcales bacterium]